MAEAQDLIPILLAAKGRSGTTALMALLGTDPRVAFDRVYPYENRYLTWLAKAAQVVGRPVNEEVVTARQLFDLADDRLGPMPRSMEKPAALMPSVHEWLQELWRSFTNTVRRREPEAIHYAEKAPHWLGPLLREIMPVRVIHLVRDPRDVLLSARRFVETTGVPQFGLTPQMSAAEQTRETAIRWMTYAECERADSDRKDALVVRYEDWINQPQDMAERIGQFLSVQLDLNSAELRRDHSRHSTSGQLDASVNRWQRESLRPAENKRMVSALADHLDRYGYQRSNEISQCPTIVPDPAWAHSSDGEWSATPDGVTVKILGGDAWIEFPCDLFNAKTIAEVWLCLLGETGDHCSVYWRPSNEPFVEPRCMHVPFLPGPHWQIARVPVGKHPEWRGTIGQMRVDICNGNIASGKTCKLRWIRYVP